MNCFQILYLRSLNTILQAWCAVGGLLWIAFRFCIFVLWTQSNRPFVNHLEGCELLSDFVSSFFEHNNPRAYSTRTLVVNCFQILYLRSLNTITQEPTLLVRLLWIAFRFCIFVLWTQSPTADVSLYSGCELLSDFVSSFFEHNIRLDSPLIAVVVNCFQILYLRSLNTIRASHAHTCVRLWIAFRFCIFVLWTQ